MKPPGLARVGLTRRGLAGYLAAPMLLSATAQAQAPAAPAPTRIQDASRALAAVKLPRSTEPATRF
ncbi:MAG: hypothetical protein ABI833_17780, partial [Acidobacteriota bacterium]